MKYIRFIFIVLFLVTISSAFLKLDTSSGKTSSSSKNSSSIKSSSTLSSSSSKSSSSITSSKSSSSTSINQSSSSTRHYTIADFPTLKSRYTGFGTLPENNSTLTPYQMSEISDNPADFGSIDKRHWWYENTYYNRTENEPTLLYFNAQFSNPTYPNRLYLTLWSNLEPTYEPPDVGELSNKNNANSSIRLARDRSVLRMWNTYHNMQFDLSVQELGYIVVGGTANFSDDMAVKIYSKNDVLLATKNYKYETVLENVANYQLRFYFEYTEEYAYYLYYQV